MSLATYVITALTLTAPPVFVDVTEQRGVEAEHGWTADAPIAGVAVLDWNDDAWPDLIVAREQSTNSLYANSGPPDFRFLDVSAAAGLSAPLKSTAIIAADFTGDGRDDLLLLPSVHSQSPSLLVGRSDGRFVDETAVRLIAPWSLYLGGAAGDIDGDGDLDLALVRWSYRGPGSARDCLEGHVFENRGGVLVWLPDLPLEGCSFLPAFTDVDEDGDVDLVQLNDYGPLFHTNRVLLSNGVDAAGAPRLVAAGEDHGLAIGVYGMGLAVGDFDGDGARDYYMSSIGEDALLRGDGQGGYSDVTDVWRADSTLGEGGRRWKWGVAMPDVDNNGHQDLVALAGAELSPIPLTDPVERSILLMNSGTPPMRLPATESGLELSSNDRGLAVTDFDADGRLDLVVTSNTRVHVMHNETSTDGHWLGLRLRGTVANRSAIGARVEAHCGEQRGLREIMGGGTPGSTHDPRIHFGLGACTGPVAVTVRWPGGLTQALDGLAVDQVHTLDEPNWLEVTPQDVAAGPGATATLTIDLPGPIELETTHGTISSAGKGPDGRWVAELSADGPGEAAITITAAGSEVPAHPRVRFRAPEELHWAHWPAVAHPGTPLRIGARFSDATGAPPQGELTLVIDGIGGSTENIPELPGSAWRTIMIPASTVPTGAAKPINVVAQVDGKAFGAPLQIAIEARVDAQRSQVFVRPSWAGPNDTVKVSVDPVSRTGARWIGHEDALAKQVVMRVDGQKVAADFVADGQSITAFVLGKAVMGTLSFEVEGVLLDQTVTVRASAPGPDFSSLSPERSFFTFFDRHIHADGEDLVPLWFVLRNDDGQDLFANGGAARLSLQTEGCTAVDGTLFGVDQELHRTYFAFVTPPTEPGVARATLLFDGQPTGLFAEVAVRSAHPHVPSLAHTTLEAVEPTQLAATQDGPVLISIVPRDHLGNRTGSGIGLNLASDTGPVGVPSHRGGGDYWVLVTRPPAPCTATIRVWTALTDGERAFELAFLGPDGAPVDRPCGAVPDAPGDCCMSHAPRPASPLAWAMLTLGLFYVLGRLKIGRLKIGRLKRR